MSLQTILKSRAPSDPSSNCAVCCRRPSPRSDGGGRNREDSMTLARNSRSRLV